MTFPAFLQDPLFVGLGLLSAGVLLLIVFALPALIFPGAPPLPEENPASALHRRVEEVFHPLARSLADLESRLREGCGGGAPTAPELRRLYDGLDALKNDLGGARSLAEALSAGARGHDELRRQADRLVEGIGVLFKAEGLPGDGSRAQARERLARRLAAWRGAWGDFLAREESALAGRRKEVETRRRALEAEMASARAGFEGSLAAAASDRERLERERRRFEEEVLRPLRTETERLEGERRELEARGEALRRGIAEAERARGEAASAAALAEDRRRAREEQLRRRDALRELRASSSAALAREEADMKTFRDRGLLETAELQEALRRARENAEKERAALSAAETELRAGMETGRAATRARVEDLRRRAAASQEVRDRLDEALRREMEEHRRETASLRDWAAGRYATLTALAKGEEEKAAAALRGIRAEKESLSQALAGEKESARRDIGVLERAAAEGRAKAGEAGRREEAAHVARMADLAREESSLAERLSALDRETSALKAQAEKLKVKAQERLARRRAAHEKLYAAAKHAAESATTSDENLLALERAAAASLEARWTVRRRRLSSLREHRRRALAGLLDGAQAALSAAAEAHRRTEGLVRERVSLLGGRAEAASALRDRWREAPRRVEEVFEEAGARADLAADAERARLLAEAERRSEEVRRMFAENRAALVRAASRLKESEGDLSGEEAAFREMVGMVEGQARRLERLKIFFDVLRSPSGAVMDRSAVA